MSVPANPALKLNVFLASFPYAGNGACSAESPHIRHWAVTTALKMKADPRIGSFSAKDFVDTPITMTRNRAVRAAKESGAHLLLMVDSDQHPDLHAGEAWYRPFWDEAFNFIYDNYHKGPRLIFAPYCGPPNHTENVYVFQWRGNANHAQETRFSLEAYTREQAATMRGIQEAAAGPTGMILIDLRLLDLVEPSERHQNDILKDLRAGKITVEDAEWELRDGYFYYEWDDQRADNKASTEDVTFTRDVSLAGQEMYGYNPVFCAWDSWIGHNKPWTVGRPMSYGTRDIGASLKKAVLHASPGPQERVVDMSLYNLGKDFEWLQKAADEAEQRFAVNEWPEQQKVEIARNPDSTPLGFIQYETGERQIILETGKWDDHGHAPLEHQNVLRDLIRSQKYKFDRPLNLLEVGSWIGRTAVAMVSATDESIIHCVDTWEGTPSDATGQLVKEAGGTEALYAKFKETAGPLLDKTVFPWRGRSVDMAKKHWKLFDLMFIDADHTYEGCLEDIRGWWKHLGAGGIMVGHDFATHGHEGVVQAVKECFGEEYMTLGWHPQGCLWVAYKDDHPDLRFDDEAGRPSPAGEALQAV